MANGKRECRRKKEEGLPAMKNTGPELRYRGSLPKLGIRPLIDGRQKGVRESLEEQTMQMAKNAAKLITNNVRHSNGMNLECVIADTTIGGAAEAAACREKFEKAGVMITLSVTPCWCYGSETIDNDPFTIKAVWGLNGTERPGAVYLACALAAYSQKGLPAFGIYGREVQDKDDYTIPEDVQDKILRFARAALAAVTMRGKNYLSIGGCSMGIAGSIVDQDFLRAYLGMGTEVIDMCEIQRRIDEEIYDREEYERAIRWVREYCTEAPDRVNKGDWARSEEQRRKDWEFCTKMTMIGRDLMIGNPSLREMGFLEEANGHNALFCGFQGQRQWTDHWCNGDFMETMLNTSWDWNGIREPFTVATENDFCNGTAMLMCKLVTNKSAMFSDVRTFWSPDAVERVTGWKPEGMAENGFLDLRNSGSTTLDAEGIMTDEYGRPGSKEFWNITGEDVMEGMKNVKWEVANGPYFRGGGFSSCFLSKGGMALTMTRLNIVKGLGPVMQIAEGWTCDLPDIVHEKIAGRTDPTWPSTYFAPRITGKGAFRDIYSVMNNWGANHGAVAFGHVGRDIITLCSILRIPVCMHNIPEEEIFRPSYWNAFGEDKEGQDYRACSALGPLYGKY